MKPRLLTFFMQVALDAAQLSYSLELKVGCIAVKGGKPISIGYNGTPPGEDNACEFKVYYNHANPGHHLEDFPLEEPFDSRTARRFRYETKPNVVHAEDNMLRGLVTSNESSVGAEVFVTHAPCAKCASRLADARVACVYYLNDYKNDEGLEHLRKRGIPTLKVSNEH